MKQKEALKRNICDFQSQMALVYKCNNDVTTTVFIVGLQTDHYFYKHQ